MIQKTPYIIHNNFIPLQIADYTTIQLLLHHHSAFKDHIHGQVSNTWQVLGCNSILLSLTSISCAMASEKTTRDEPRENRENERGKREQSREKQREREIEEIERGKKNEITVKRAFAARGLLPNHCPCHLRKQVRVNSTTARETGSPP